MVMFRPSQLLGKVRERSRSGWIQKNSTCLLCQHLTQTGISRYPYLKCFFCLNRITNGVQDVNSGLCVSQQCNGKTIVICKYSSSDTGLCIYVSLVKEISEKPGNVGNRVHVLCGNILLALNSVCSIPCSILETWLTNFYWITAVETNLFNLLEETQNSWGAWGQTRRWSETYKDWTNNTKIVVKSTRQHSEPRLRIHWSSAGRRPRKSHQNANCLVLFIYRYVFLCDTRVTSSSVANVRRKHQTCLKKSLWERRAETGSEDSFNITN